MDPMADASTVERMLLSQARERNIPMNGSIELLPLCNLNCKMCYVRLSREEMEAQGRLRTAEEWISVAKEMKEAGVLFLLLTGGEPLLYPGFKELFVELKKMGMVLTTNTNGTMIDEEWADFFAENKPRRINITLYGSSEETYRELCRSEQGFAKVMNGIHLLKERDVDVKIAVSATKANEKDILDIVEIGRQLNLPVAVDTYMMPAVRERNLPYDFQARLHPRKAARVRMEVLKRIAKEGTFEQYCLNMMEQSEQMAGREKKEEGICCMAGVCSFTVNWKGHLQPCVIMDHPYVSVFEEGFKAAWDKVMTAAKDIKTNEKCSVCKYRPVCRTCAASGMTEVGDYKDISPYMCEYAEESYRLIKEEMKKMQEGAND